MFTESLIRSRCNNRKDAIAVLNKRVGVCIGITAVLLSVGIVVSPAAAKPGAATGALPTSPSRTDVLKKGAPLSAIATAAQGRDSFASAEVLSGTSGSISRSTTSATLEPLEPVQYSGGASIWFSYTPGVAGSLSLDTCGSDFDTTVAVYTGASVSLLTLRTKNDDDLACSPSSRVALDVTVGVKYSIQVDGYNAATGDASLLWRLGPRGDDFGARIPLTGASGSAAAATVGASFEFEEPAIRSSYTGQSIWYSYVPLTDGRLSVSTCGSSFDTLLGVYTGPNVWSLQLAASNDDDSLGFCQFQSFLALNVVAGNEYLIQVDGYNGDAGNVVLSWDLAVAFTQGNPPSLVGTFRPISGDFDGDNRSDIIWYAPGTGVDTWWRGRANGTFAGGPAVTINGTYTPVVGDFNGDGKSDVLLYAPGTASDYLKYGASSGWASGPPVNVNGTYVPIVGDFNGDGFSDILWYTPGYGADYMRLGSPSGLRVGPAVNINGTYTPVVGFFNTDDTSDVLWYTPGTGADYMRYGSGTGFVAGPAINVNGTYVPVAGDFDGDVLTDIVWYSASGPDPLWRSNGFGFTGGPPVSVTSGYRSIVGDFNGDGRDDIFWHASTRSALLMFGN